MTEVKSHERYALRLAIGCWIAVASGFGGLLFELVCLRRTTLTLGYGSVGQALVLGAFLTGLGLGGLLLPRLAFFARRPLRGASLLWILVAAAIPGLDFVLDASLGPAAPLLAFAVPLLASVPMGGAFPLLFPYVTATGSASQSPRAHGIGLLQAANLGGSVLAAALGASWCIPVFGLRTSALIAAGIYGLAALSTLAVDRVHGRAAAATPAALDDASPGFGRAAVWRIAASGFAVLGLELWLPRRLVFGLGGFLPTLAGSLVGVLIGLAIGGMAVEFVRRSSFGRRVRGSHLALAVCVGTAISIAIVELAIPLLSTLVLSSFASRLVAASLIPCVMVLPATIPLGMLVPWELETLVRDDRRGLAAHRAGEAFFVFAIGALAASFVLPFAFGLPIPLLLLPVLSCVPLIAGLIASRGGIHGFAPGVLAVAALVGSILPFVGRPTLVGARNFDAVSKRVVAEDADRVTTASVVQDIARSERTLYTDEFSAAGGDRSGYMRALGILAARFAAPRGKRVLICLGTGTTAAALARSEPGARIDVVEISPAVVRLAPRFTANWADYESRVRLHVEDGRHYTESLEPGSVGTLTLEPLLPQAPGSVHLYSLEFYESVARALGDDGVCVQWFPTHALDPAAYRSLLRSFLAVFPYRRAYLLDESTLLVGGKSALRARPIDAAADIDRWICGLWDEDDWRLAELPLAALGPIEEPFVVDDRPFLERRAFAPGVEILSWLPANLASYVVSAPGEEALQAARACRLRARVALARAPLDPTALDLANTEIRSARKRYPSSLLLRREEGRIHALLAERRALRAVAQGEFRRAERDFVTATRLAGSTALREAARVVCAWADARPDEARQRLAVLAASHPNLLEIPAIARRRGVGFAALWDAPELARVLTAASETQRALPRLNPLEFVSALAADESWARDFWFRRPLEARFRLATALAESPLAESPLLEPSPLLGRLLADFDRALLARLEPWVRRDVRTRLEFLARHVKTEDRPEWWTEHGRALDAWAGEASEPRRKALWAELVERFGLEAAESAEPATAIGRRTRAAVLRARFF